MIPSLPYPASSIMHDCMRLFGLTDLMVRPLAARSRLGELTNMVNDPNPNIRYMAVTVLGRTGEGGVPGLVQALASGQPTHVRIAAIQALGMQEGDASPAAQDLGKLLADPDPVVRDQATSALAKIGLPAMPVLREALVSPDMAVRSAAATALARNGSDEAKDAVNDLRTLANTSPPTTAAQLCVAAARSSGDPGDCLLPLSDVMNDPDAAVRASGVRAAAELGPVGMPLQELLMARMVDPSPLVRCEAAKALAQVAPDSPRTQAAMANLLRDPHPDARAAAASVMPMLGPSVRGALDAASKKATGKDFAMLQSASQRLDYLSRPDAYAHPSQIVANVKDLSSMAQA